MNQQRKAEKYAQEKKVIFLSIGLILECAGMQFGVKTRYFLQFDRD